MFVKMAIAVLELPLLLRDCYNWLFKSNKQDEFEMTEIVLKSEMSEDSKTFDYNIYE